MGHGGVAEGWRGTQRPTGATVVVVVAALVFLSASAGLASASHHHICQADSSVKLMPYETAYFTSRALSVRFRVEAVGCVNDTLELRLADLEVSNQTSTNKTVQWYEFSYINCEKYVVNIGSKIVKLERSSHKCIDKPITLTVVSPALLGKKCLSLVRDKAVHERGKAACKTLAGVADASHSLVTKPVADHLGKLLDLLSKHENYDTSDLSFDPSSFGDDKNDGKILFDTPGLFFGGQQEPKGPKLDDKYFSDMFKTSSYKYEDFLPVAPPTVPTNNIDDDTFFDNETFSKRRNYKENAIPIFIGIVAFTVSMCLRFCLCRGKSVVRRVTTVTVIRSRPSNSDTAQDQQDPPPAYVDVVNENMPRDSPAADPCAEPPPPAYADIAHEVLPPTYSEVEAQSMSPSEAASLADQETVTQTSSSPPDPGSGSDDKSSGASRGVLSKYRSQQKQFAFKVLEEDE